MATTTKTDETHGADVENDDVSKTVSVVRKVAFWMGLFGPFYLLGMMLVGAGLNAALGLSMIVMAQMVTLRLGTPSEY